uniref:C3H1-type domain-containing protein n=1 Tax=Alexandrium monilatum TaxID=311494 RepID=A0A7S4V6A8_9DINO
MQPAAPTPLLLAPAMEEGPHEQPLIYPAPLYVQNTFLTSPDVRPASLEDFYSERQVRSCPGSQVVEPAEPKAEDRPARKRSAYYPGQLVHRVAAALARTGMRVAPSGGKASECSTAVPSSPNSGTEPQPGSPELPSLGSSGHALGQCKPCVFVGKRGCRSGVNCEFCHACEPGEKKRRQKEKRAFFSALRRASQEQGAAVDAEATMTTAGAPQNA